MCARASYAWAACAAWAAWAAWAAASLLPLDAERLRASVGGYAVMNCHLDFPFGNEIPYHLQWDKDGESIYSWYSGAGEEGARVGDRWGGRVRRLGDGRLGLGRGAINVSAVRETDAGLYRCRVTFPNRTPPARNNGTFYRLEVEGGNLIATPPVNVTVLEGERAELECLPKSAEAAVQWFREGAPLDATPELAQRAERAPNGSLVLRAAASSDPGEYSCRVQDPAGRAQSASAFLDVQYKAKVVYSPKERFLPLGKPASLDCHFSANPPLTNLRWEKDGFLFDPYNVPGVFYSRNGSLLFNQVDETHEGQYSCTPYNALGSGGASARVRVRVRRPPALAARPRPLYVARLGGELVLPCALPAGADAALSWARRDGVALPADRHAVDAAALRLAPVREEDGGVYVCSAVNDAAAVRAETEVLVENAPPRAPRNLTAAAARSAVHLAWQPPAAAAAADYAVWYRERDAGEWRTMKILSRGVTEATVEGLRPATAYELRVLAQDLIGDGLFSRPVFVSTLPADGEPPEDQGESERREAARAAADPPEPDAEGADALEVAVRLLDDGVLVRWAGAPDGARCAVRWYQDERLLAAVHTHHDYFLVKEVSEGLRYSARVQCGAAAGGAALAVPQYARLRGVAAGCAAGTLALGALAAALYLARRRLPRPRVPCAKRR